MSDTVDLSPNGKEPFSLSKNPVSQVRPISTPNIDIDASDGPYTGSPRALRDLENDPHRYNGLQDTSASTTGKERKPKATSRIDRIATSLPPIKQDWWYTELGACLTSALAMIVLIIVIGRHNGKPLPKWPLHINVGTFIAVCSNITKATLLVPVVASVSQYKWYSYKDRPKKQSLETIVLVDHASRGIPGSIKLLLSERKGAFASLGALLIILAIPIEPFFQEAVHTPQGMVRDMNGSQPTIAKIQRYTHPWPIQIDLLDSPLFKGEYTAERSVKAAVYEGLFGDSRGMTASCSTGICTWPKFTSLSLCSRCQNVTTSIDSLHSLPNGLNLAEKASVNATTSIDLSQIGYTPWALLNMSVLGHDAAYECSVFWCVKEYSTTMINGTLYENEEMTWSNDTLEYDRDESMNSLSRACIYEQGLGNENQSGLALQNGDCHGGIGCCYINFYANGSDAANMTFSVDYMTHYTLRSFLEDSLQGNITLPYQTSPVYTPDEMQALVTLHRPVPRHSNFTAAEDIVSNMTLVDVPELIDNITKSVTIRFRQAVDPEDTTNRVIGTAYQSLPIIDFRWQWLIYPGILLLSAFFFLVKTIMMNSNDHNLWKSEAAAMLCTGLAEEIRLEANGNDKLSQMNELMKKTEVELKKTDDGWRLC